MSEKSLICLKLMECMIFQKFNTDFKKKKKENKIPKSHTIIYIYIYGKITVKIKKITNLISDI